MKKRPNRRRSQAKPPPIDPLAAQLAEFTKLVMLGANLFYAGMKQAAPATTAAPPQFTVTTRSRREKKDDEQLPEV